jgi:hypothetical protein
MTTRRMADLVRNQRPVIFAPEAIVKDVCRRMREQRTGAALAVGASGNRVAAFLTSARRRGRWRRRSE